jgi:PAS domain-containing protein
VSNRTVESAAQAMASLRGRARQARRVFDCSSIPMALVDSERRHLEANRATRLLFRMSLAELRARRMDELTPSYEWTTAPTAWEELLSQVFVSGTSRICFPDGSHLAVVYAAVTNCSHGNT